MVCPGVGRDGSSSFFFLVIFLCCSLSPSRSWLPIAGSSTLPDTRGSCLSRRGTYSQHSSLPTPQPQSSPSTSLSAQFSLTPSPRSSHTISRSAFRFPFLTCSWTCYAASYSILAFPGLQYDYLSAHSMNALLPSPVIPLSRYPPIPQYAIPSVDVTLPPSSREPPDLGPHATPLGFFSLISLG